MEPKQRILEISAELFAQKGYAAIGVREIAAKANVNLSMISYYFGGKVGILKAIIEEYYEEQKKNIQKISQEKYGADTILKHIEFINDTFHKSSSAINDPIMRSIVGPAFISLIYSNFLIGQTSKGIYNVEFNDEYYDKYAEVIATMFLSGIRGLGKACPEDKKTISQSPAQANIMESLF